MSPRIVGFSLLLALAGCQGPPPAPMGAAGSATGSTRADQAAMAYCRQRAEDVYNTQNRGARFQSDSRDSPFSGAYVPSVTSRGLSDRYALDAMVADCMRNSSASRDASPEPASPAPPAPLPAPPPAAPARR